ncbi:MAG: hypothetical protein HYX75_03700 [Acidobacteria bacterium]|nr:hypothetical protein [Acidobacteriota bacterium]
MKNWWMVPMAFLAVAFSVSSTKADEDAQKKDEQIELVLKSDRDGNASTIELNDMHALAMGESRTYYSDDGKQATVTREEDGFKVEFDGKVTHIKSGINSLSMRDGGQFVTVDGDDGKKCFVANIRSKGKDGKQFVYAYKTGNDERLDVDAIIRNIEKSEHFSELDPEAQEKIREAIRDLKDNVDDNDDARKTIVINIEDEE